MAKTKPASSGKSAGGGGGKSKQQKHSKPTSSASPAAGGSGSGGDAPAGARPAKKEKEPPAPHEDFSVGPRAPLRKVSPCSVANHAHAITSHAYLQLVFLLNENVPS